METKQEILPETQNNTGNFDRRASWEEILQAVSLAEKTIQLLDSDIFRQAFERGDLILEKTTNPDGKLKSVTIKTEDGQLFFYENVAWINKKIAERRAKTEDRMAMKKEVLKASSEINPHKMN